MYVCDILVYTHTHTPDDKFTEMQRGFMDKHYHHFEDVEENKFIYTDIFKEYVSGPPPLPLSSVIVHLSHCRQS